MKKLLLLTVLTGWFNHMYAQQAAYKKSLHQSPGDSTLKKESAKIAALSDGNKVAKNPAFYFKDLFESDALAISANSGPKLNPRAVSFVDDYIERHARDLG